MNALTQGALNYAKRGLRVHPCEPNCKTPLLSDWPNRATLYSGSIEQWWTRWPSANVAIATGGAARLLVVDIDPDSGGEASWARLEQAHGPLTTVEAVTPRGGRHLYLIVPDARPMPGNSAGKLGPGIDTRGQGGYVLAPPSVVNGRPYSWSVDSGDRIATAPGWLLDRLSQADTNGDATPAEEWQKIAIARSIDEGTRNATITRVAGLLFRRLPEPELAATLMVCFNQVKCRPPLDAGELKRTLDSIAAREMRRRRLT